MNAESPLTREAFDSWLSKQPDNREFIYVNGLSNDEVKCPICAFLSEKYHITKELSVSSHCFKINTDIFDIPEWALDFDRIEPLTAGAIKKHLNKFTVCNSQ